MATLHWQRSISSDVSGVKSTFSSWDSCMSKAYCKWPAIVGIIIGSLIVLSILMCVAKIICFGAECCFCCVSCLRCCSCCKSNGRRSNKGYSQPEPAPQFQNYPQYQSAPPPMYSTPAQPVQAHYAQYDAPGGQRGYRTGGDDALPAMPSWDNANSRRVEDQRTPDEEMELEKLDYSSAQAQPMLPKVEPSTPTYPYQNGAGAHSGDMGNNRFHQPSASPYDSQRQSYGQQQQPASNPYEQYGQQQQHQQGYHQGYGNGAQSSYAPSVPPSYHTSAPSVVAPGVGRKPVQGSWRDL